jgi:hypothetical protein
MIKIEKNVPIPKPRSNYSKYPFGEMEVGDSFVVLDEDRTKIAPAVSWYGKRNNKKFTVRNLPDGVCRVWRIK